MSPGRLARRFAAATGGRLLAAPRRLRERALALDGYLFDWDGVFNDGRKTGEAGSPFDEADAMGTNLLRFGHWLARGALPFCAILTGEHNPAAVALARRERFHAVYLGARDKRAALDHLLDENGLAAERLAFTFDDVLDLPLAARCGLRVLVRRRASPLLAEHVRRRRLADYQTGQPGGAHAVREVCELLLGLTDRFERAVVERGAFEPHYRAYLAARNRIETRVYRALPEGGFAAA